jgi:gluconolactonase
MERSDSILEVNDPRLLDLIDPQAQIEQLCTGYQFTEGPIWNPVLQCLYFSDIPGDARGRWSPAEGAAIVRSPNNKGNGMTYDAAGNLYVCEHATSSLIRETPSGERQVLASHWQGKELNSPNDVVVRSDGSVYFTDPTYGRMPGFGVERPQDLSFQGLYRISPDGTLHLEADDFAQPNGLCFSPDEKLLYVNDTVRAHIRVFDVSADGALSGGRVFAEQIGDGVIEHGVVDGMKCDQHGNVYVTGPRGLWVFSPAAEFLGVIRLPENCANLNWGGPDWKDLFCTCTSSVYRVRTKVCGSPVPYQNMR